MKKAILVTLVTVTLFSCKAFADEDKMVQFEALPAQVKEFVNTDGKILTNIFEIANQARLLHGEYEGYRVDVVE